MKKKTQQSVKDVIALANEQLGEGTIILPELGQEMINEKPEVISTGHPEIDSALGVGGLPRGRIVEILGEEASGKTTLVLHVIKEAQKMGLSCTIIDSEHSLDKERAIKIGVDFDKLAISQPDSGEQALELLDILVRSETFGVIVIDSVAAMVPIAEIEGEMKDATIGVMARLMGKSLRKIVGPANKGKTLVIFTNQLRDKIGGFMPMPMKVGSGGNALKFYSSVRIDMRRTKNNKSGEKLLSTQHKVTIKKNKMAPPMSVVSVKIGDAGWML